MKERKGYSTAAQVWALRQYGEVGPRTFRALIATFGNPEAVHQAEISELSAIEGLGEKRSQKIYDSCNCLDESEDFLKSLETRNIKYSTIFDESYPGLFEELNDPPPIIFYRTELPQEGEKTVAIVGSHNATNEGIGYAVELASKLAMQSVSIVSGLARGIDAGAHIGALKAGGRTFALLGSGLDNIYPEDNRPLANEIAKHGGLISEYRPDAGYSTRGLMARNRLVVGLSQAVIIGELLTDSSGTLDTATFCDQLGKIMFVLMDDCDRPGRDNSSVDKVLSMGAIPIRLDDGIDIILKSLV